MKWWMKLSFISMRLVSFPFRDLSVDLFLIDVTIFFVFIRFFWFFFRWKHFVILKTIPLVLILFSLLHSSSFVVEFPRIWLFEASRWWRLYFFYESLYNLQPTSHRLVENDILARATRSPDEKPNGAFSKRSRWWEWRRIRERVACCPR